MATRKTKIVRVPATTNNITKGIINYLNAKGHFAFRVNSGGVWDPRTNEFRRGRSAGVADILCCIKVETTEAFGGGFNYRGEFLAIEVKNGATKDRSRPAQRMFGEKLEAAGGDYTVARSYDQFVKWFETVYRYRVAQ